MKKGTKNLITGLGVVLLLVGALWYFGTDWIGAGGSKALNTAGTGQQTTTQTGTQTQQLAGTCTVPLSTAQTVNIAGFDADKPATAVSGIATTVFTDSSAGKILPGNTTVPGSTYSILASKSGSLKAFKPVVMTSCTEAAPQIPIYLETYDSAPTVTVYNVGGRTANAVNTVNQTLTAASPATFQIEVQPSALYKHIAGGAPEGQMGSVALFFNYTNSSDWDTSGFALSTYGAWGSSSCTPYSGATPTYTGVVLKGFTCPVDFSGKDSAIYGFYATVKPSSIYANGAKAVLTATIVPVDYFQNTVTGVLSTGPVKDDGSAIQTGIQKGIGLA